MNTLNQPFRITARWDQDEAPTGNPADHTNGHPNGHPNESRDAQLVQRGLLVEITAAEVAKPAATPRPPVNLAIVIDRSGSMKGAPLLAAIEAAAGVAQRLGDADRLSVVAYDDHVNVLLDGELMTPAGRERAESVVRGLRSGGSTDLAAGWLQGAHCVADAMQRHELQHGHVILLSDGHANQGTVDPGELGRLAAGLAERRVTSTCVGIGADYSLLQLGAIAEGGQGEMHQSSEPGEIIEVLLGELGEQMHLAARECAIALRGEAVSSVRQLTRYQETTVDGRTHYVIGNLVAGQTRRLALLVDFTTQTRPGEQHCEVSATWLNVEAEASRGRLAEMAILKFVPPAGFDAAARNAEVATEIGRLWMARRGYDAMMLNEQGRYQEAVESIDLDAPSFCRMVAGLEDTPQFMSALLDTREATAKPWGGLSKKEAMLSARKRMRAKPDFRAQHEASEWTDYRPGK